MFSSTNQQVVIKWSHFYVKLFIISYVRQFLRNGVGRGYLLAVKGRALARISELGVQKYTLG